MRRKAAWWGAAAALCVGVLLTRVHWDGRRALADGDAARDRGDLTLAITRWRRAARWYAPGAGHVAKAYRRLEDTARRAEAGDPSVCPLPPACRALALEAWRAIRSSSLSTRSFYTPYAKALARANARIAVLMAEEEGDLGLRPELTPQERQAWHQELLDRKEAPSVGWTVVALVGLVGWIGGGFWFAWRGIRPDQRLDRRAAAQAGVLVLVGVTVWMAGLYWA